MPLVFFLFLKRSLNNGFFFLPLVIFLKGAADLVTDNFGSVFSGVSNLAGGFLQNSSAKSIAADNNATAINLANTAHQREVADLQAAGLNPILSANRTGAATPSLQTYSPQNILGPAAQSAFAYKTLVSQLENIEADTAQKREAANLSKEQQVATREQAQNLIADYWLKDAQKQLTFANTSSAQNAARLSSLDLNAQEGLGVLFKQLGLGANTAKALTGVVGNAVGSAASAKNILSKSK